MSKSETFLKLFIACYVAGLPITQELISDLVKTTHVLHEIMIKEFNG